MYGTHGGFSGGNQGNYGGGEAKREKLYDDGDYALYEAVFFFAREMLMKGEFGKIQFLRGSHYQDMANWPSYWLGLPPMWYGTHAIAPMRAMAGARICKVHCFGSGYRWRKGWRNNMGILIRWRALFFPLKTAEREATRTLFETARVYQEGCLFMEVTPALSGVF